MDSQFARRIALLAGQGTILMLYLQYMLDHPGIGEARAGQALNATGVFIGLIVAYGALMLEKRPRLAQICEWFSIAIFVGFVAAALWEWAASGPSS